MKRLDLAFETVKQSALEDAPALQVRAPVPSSPLHPFPTCCHRVSNQNPTQPNLPNKQTKQVILRVRPIPPGKESCLALVPGTSKVQTTTPSNSVNFKILGEQVRRTNQIE